MILHSNSVEHRLVVFSFPLNYSQNKNVDLLFVEDDEIMFNGKMYDIVHQYKSADSIFIKCISDEIEDDVREEASNQINKTKGNTAQKNFSAFKFNPGPFTTGSETYEFYYIVNCFCATFLFLKDFKPVACYLNVPSPPPWNNV